MFHILSSVSLMRILVGPQKILKIFLMNPYIFASTNKVCAFQDELFQYTVTHDEVWYNDWWRAGQ